jgi:hypothetical protein
MDVSRSIPYRIDHPQTFLSDHQPNPSDPQSKGSQTVLPALINRS